MPPQDSGAIKIVSTPSGSAPRGGCLVNLGFQLDKARYRAVSSESNDDVPREKTVVDEFSGDRSGSTAKGVTNYRVPALCGNNNAHPIKFGWASIHDEVCGDLLVPASNNLTKIAGFNDAIVSREHRRKSNGDFAATLAATGGKDRTTGAGAHAQTETVNLRTATVVGLVSTLRHLFSSASGRHI